MTVFAQFERIRTPTDVSSLRLLLFVSLAGMGFVRGGCVPLPGIDSSMVLAEAFCHRVEGIRVCHPVEVVRYCPVLTLLTDEIPLLQP